MGCRTSAAVEVQDTVVSTITTLLEFAEVCPVVGPIAILISKCQEHIQSAQALKGDLSRFSQLLATLESVLVSSNNTLEEKLPALSDLQAVLEDSCAFIVLLENRNTFLQKLSAAKSIGEMEELTSRIMGCIQVLNLSMAAETQGKIDGLISAIGQQSRELETTIESMGGLESALLPTNIGALLASMDASDAAILTQITALGEGVSRVQSTVDGLVEESQEVSSNVRDVVRTQRATLDAVEELKKMLDFPKPESERTRLAVLNRLDIVNQDPEEWLEKYLELARRVMDVRVCCLNMVMDTTQKTLVGAFDWDGLKHSLSGMECHRHISTCQYTICGDTFVAQDQNTKGLLMTYGDDGKMEEKEVNLAPLLGARIAAQNPDSHLAFQPDQVEKHLPCLQYFGELSFYAGSVIKIKEENVGAFCVLDRKERRDFEKDGEMLSIMNQFRDVLLNYIKFKYVAAESKREQANEIVASIFSAFGMKNSMDMLGTAKETPHTEAEE